MAHMQLKKARKNTKGETIVEILPNNVKDNPNETDDMIMERMRERFQILDDMTQASIDGVVRGMVVTGPPGVGKSFSCMKWIAELRKTRRVILCGPTHVSARNLRCGGIKPQTLQRMQGLFIYWYQGRPS